jgi:hypothetical protein
MMKTHKLKTVNPHFKEVWEGNKTFEIRRDDRSFEVGDMLILQEYIMLDVYTGREVNLCVTHILKNAPQYGLKIGYVIMSLSPICRKDERGKVDNLVR